MSTANFLFCVVVNAEQTMTSILTSRSEGGCIMPVTCLSVYICDLM